MANAVNTPYTYYDLSNDPNIISQDAELKLWGNTKDKSPLTALLANLPKGKPQRLKRINFAIGDYFPKTLTLSAAVNPSTASQITFTSTGDFLFKGDVLYLFHNTVTDNWAQIRILGKDSGTTYNFELISTSGSASFTTALTSVLIVSSAVGIHNDAREYLNKKGDIGWNWAQRSRDTVGKSDFEDDNTFIENGLAHLIQLGYEFYGEKRELAYFTNMAAKGGANENDEWNLAGGLPYFLDPHGVTFGDTAGIRNRACENDDFVGQNLVVDGTTFTYKNLREWGYKLGDFGKKNKMLFAGDTMYELMYQLLEDNVGIQNVNYQDIMPAFPVNWVVQKAQVGPCTFFLVRDTAINGMPMMVKNNVTADVLTADPNKWMVALDMLHVRETPYVNNKGVIKNPTMREIDRINNGSVDKMEFDSMGCLTIDEPRSCGYFGITG